MLRIAFFSILLTVAAPALAEPLLYRLDDADSTVWLLGSVHALRAGDYPLDQRIESAYRNAERVVLEVAPAELDPAHLASVALPLARFADDRRLADVLTDEEYDRVRRHLRTLGIDVQQFRAFEPWFVGLQIFALHLARSDYASAEGVDKHFAARASADGKRTDGLETAEEQFRMFDELPLEQQKRLLLETIDDGEDFGQYLDRLVNIWRRGDEAALAAMIKTEFGNAPELRDALLDARNARWATHVDNYLARPDDALIIVGALHLVGEEGLVELLEEKGYEVTKVRSEK